MEKAESGLPLARALWSWTALPGLRHCGRPKMPRSEGIFASGERYEAHYLYDGVEERLPPRAWCKTDRRWFEP